MKSLALKFQAEKKFTNETYVRFYYFKRISFYKMGISNHTSSV